ncbi:hypothetical protein ANTQUA_LOCUS6094 [Anthophora quadrimaculata]
MADGLQQRDSMDYSPKKLVRKIESCVFRNALNEEERAQKTLYLLRTRDYQIAFLEKRVAELEAAAAELHEIAIQQSLKSTSMKIHSKTSTDVCKSEKSCKTENDDETDDKSDPYMSSNDTLPKDNSNENYHVDNRVSVPCLKLSKSSMSNSEKEIFSTAIDFDIEKMKYLPLDTSFSFSNDDSEKTIEADEKSVNCSSETVTKVVNNPRTTVDNREMIEGDSEKKSVIICENKSDRRSSSTTSVEKNKEKVAADNDRKKCINLPKGSSSVPWIRAKQCYRKKLRGFELKAGRRFKELSGADGHVNFPAFG